MCSETSSREGLSYRKNRCYSNLAGARHAESGAWHRPLVTAGIGFGLDVSIVPAGPGDRAVGTSAARDVAAQFDECFAHIFRLFSGMVGSRNG